MHNYLANAGDLLSFLFYSFEPISVVVVGYCEFIFIHLNTNFCCCHWLNQTSKFSAQWKPYTAKEVVCQNHEFRCPCTSSLLPIHENWQLFWEILWKFANRGIWSAAWKLFYGVFCSQIYTVFCCQFFCCIL